MAGALSFASLPTLAAPADAMAPPVAAEPQASEPATAEAPKIQCFTKHEEAQISRRGGHLLEARDAARTCSRATCPSAIRADCVEWLDQIERSIPSVVVTARDGGLDLPNVRVFIDGEKATDRLTGAAIELDPGEHRFRFESPGRPPIERAFLVSEGMKRRPIDIDFAPPGPPAPRGSGAAVHQPSQASRPRLSGFDYAAGSLAIAALGTSAYFGIWGLIARDDLEESCAPVCTSAERQSAETKFLVADLALGVAAFSLVLLYLHRLSTPAPMSASRPRSFSFYAAPSESGGRLGLGGAF